MGFIDLGISTSGAPGPGLGRTVNNSSRNQHPVQAGFVINRPTSSMNSTVLALPESPKKGNSAVFTTPTETRKQRKIVGK